jgi:hypothetical protein
LPSTLPASAALARPGPIDAAICATVTGPSNFLMLPSGSRMSGMAFSSAAFTKQKSADEPHFSLSGNACSRPACELARD